VAYLLDTCLLSEIWKPAPNQGVMEWLSGTDEEELFLSALALGELKKRIGKLGAGRKKQRLLRDYGRLRSRFSSRILGITAVVAERWGELTADASRAGRHLHVVDGLVAATALIFGHTVVTRNEGDFAMTAVPVHNPWS